MVLSRLEWSGVVCSGLRCAEVVVSVRKIMMMSMMMMVTLMIMLKMTLMRMMMMMMRMMMTMMMMIMLMMLIMVMMMMMMMMIMIVVTGAFLPLSHCVNLLALTAQRVSLCRRGGSPPHGRTATALEQVLSRNGHPTRVSLPVLVALVVRYFRLAMSCTCRDLASPLLGLVVPVRV